MFSMASHFSDKFVIPLGEGKRSHKLEHVFLANFAAWDGFFFDCAIRLTPDGLSGVKPAISIITRKYEMYLLKFFNIIILIYINNMGLSFIFQYQKSVTIWI